MIAIIATFFVTSLILGFVPKKDRSRAYQGNHASQKCPNCGSPVTIRGTHWECMYCGNSGII